MKLTWVFTLAGFGLLATVSKGAEITNRGVLDGSLGGGTSFIETFEGHPVAPNHAISGLGKQLDSPTFGLLPGATYKTTSASGGFANTLQWNGDNWYGLHSRTMLSNYRGEDIDYTIPVNAVGIDLSAYQGYENAGYVQFFDGASLLGTVNVNLLGPDSTFIGWSNPNGHITRMHLQATTQTWGLIHDNHQFGMMAVPEVGSYLGIAFGIALMVAGNRKRSRTR